MWILQKKRIFGCWRKLLISFLYRRSALGFCNEDGYLGITDNLLLALCTEGWCYGDVNKVGIMVL